MAKWYDRTIKTNQGKQVFEAYVFHVYGWRNCEVAQFLELSDPPMNSVVAMQINFASMLRRTGDLEACRERIERARKIRLNWQQDGQ